jgi:SNF2 family DNA or RNA helicase
VPVDYLHRHEPWAHQREIFMLSRDKESWAMLMEAGSGKSMPLVDTTAWLHLQGKINAMVVVTDSSVRRTWQVEHLPRHMPEYIEYEAHLWVSQKAGNKGVTEHREELLNYDGLAVIICNWAAFRTDKFKAYIRRFLDARDAIMILDESTAIKTPGAKQTKAIVAAGKRAKYRRIATGTPVADGPFDLYSQFKFLDPEILGYGSFFTFKHAFGIFQKRYTASHDFEELQEYVNLDKLNKLMAGHSSRVLKADCFDIPPKVYEKVYAELTKDQLTALTRLREEAEILITEADGLETVVEIPMAMTIMQRAQQILSGFMMHEGKVVHLFDKPPKLEVLGRQLEILGNKQSIVWGNWIAELDIIEAGLKARGISVARYDGHMTQRARDESEAAYKAGDLQVFLATEAAASKGRNLQMAAAVYYHSNSYKLIDRLQSEDRPHRGDTTHSILYVDIIAQDTGDERVVDALRDKRNIAAEVTGDTLTDWI